MKAITFIKTIIFSFIIIIITNKKFFEIEIILFFNETIFTSLN